MIFEFMVPFTMFLSVAFVLATFVFSLRERKFTGN